MCLPTWRRAGKRFQGRGVPPPVVYLVVGGSRAGSWAGGGRSSNACAISMKSPLVSAGHTCKRGAACVRTSFDISPNLKLNCQEPKLARSYELARIKPSRLRRGSTGFSASSLLTEKRRLPVAAGAARPAAGSAQGLVQDVVDPHLASGGRPRRCRSSSRQIGVCRSHTLRRARRIRAGRDSPGRPCESQAPGPCWPSRAS